MRKNILTFLIFLGSLISFSQEVVKLSSFNLKPSKTVSDIISLDNNTAIIPFTVPYMLWRTDGTVSGTYLLQSFKNENPPQYENFCDVLGLVNGKAIMLIYTNSFGKELWVSDGTISGTNLLVDFVPGKEGLINKEKITDNSVIIDNTIYFLANSDSVLKIMKTDGTISGTEVFLDSIETGFTITMPQLYLNGDYFYTMYKGKFHKINIATKEITSVNVGGLPHIIDLISYKDSSVLILYDALPSSYLSKFNFVNNKLEVLSKFKGLFYYREGKDKYIYKINNDFYFFADSTKQNSYDLYKTDGTINGTNLVLPLKIVLSLRRFIEYDDKVWFLNFSDSSYTFNSLAKTGFIQDELDCIRVSHGQRSIGVVENNLFVSGAFVQTGDDMEPHLFHPKSGKLLKIGDVGKFDSESHLLTKLKDNQYLFYADYTPDSTGTLFLIKAYPTKTTSIQTNQHIKIYPNPSKEGWNVDFEAFFPNSEVSYTISDALGTIVNSGILTNTDQYIEGNRLSSGIYYITLKLKAEIQTQMLIKY